MRSWILAALGTVGLFASPVASAAPDGCAALGGTVEGRGMCHVHATAPAYMMNLRFPADYYDEQAIVDYVTKIKDGFLNVAQEPGGRNLPYQLDIISQSFRSAQTNSAVLKLFEDVGGAHPTNWFKSFTYNVNTGQPVTFDTVFPPGVLEKIFPIVRSQLETETDLAGSISAADGLNPAHYQNFAITDSLVIFFFGRGELLPSYADATSAVISRSQIPPLQL